MAKVHDRLVAALAKRGATPSADRTSRKYTVLVDPKRVGHVFLVGKAGALLHGRTIASAFALPGLRDDLLRSEP